MQCGVCFFNRSSILPIKNYEYNIMHENYMDKNASFVPKQAGKKKGSENHKHFSIPNPQ